MTPAGAGTPPPVLLVAERKPTIRRVVRTLVGECGRRLETVASCGAALGRLADAGGCAALLVDGDALEDDPERFFGSLHDAVPGGAPPVVVLAARGACRRRKLLAAGADVVVRKPFSPTKFRDRIERLLHEG